MASKNVPGLSSDVWAKVFEHMLPQVPHGKSGSGKPERIASDICNFQALQQVCKQFQEIFKEQTHYHALLFLPETMKQNSWESLLTWVHHHQAKVQELYTLGPKMTAAMLAPASSFHLCPVARNDLTDCGMDCLLASLTSLTSCSLHISAFGEESLDLTLLQNLHHLQNLTLETWPDRFDRGLCCNLNALQHLTKLVVHDAQVTAAADCSFVDKLQCFDIEYAYMAGMHSAGLAACQNLCHLCCRCSVIAAQADVDTLVTNSFATRVPSVISNLTRLTQLEILFEQSPSLAPEAKLELDWLCSLTTLRKLEIVSECALSFPACASQLSELGDLRLTMYSDFPSELDVNWAALCHLRQLHLAGWNSCFVDHRLQGLTEIKTLSDVHIDVNHNSRGCHGKVLKALKEAIGTNAPWIKLHW